MGRFGEDEIVWSGTVDGKTFVEIMELACAIDWWDAAGDENGRAIYASPELAGKFREAGWDGHGSVQLAMLTQELSQYRTASRQTAWFAKSVNNGTSYLGFIEKPSSIKPIETIYKGYRFRSRLEARWAVYFDACGIDWEYEPEGFDLGDGIWYLPDFLLHGVRGRAGEDLWVEVKGVMNSDDEEKIIRFSGYRNTEVIGRLENPIYVVGNIPKSETYADFINDLDMYHKNAKVPFFNFQFIDGDYFGAIPCMTNDGFEICGDDSNYLWNVDKEKTMAVLRAARGARFEHGEHGYNNNL